MLFSFVTVMLGALSELGLPYLLAEVVNRGILQDDMAFVARTGGLMLLLAVTSVVCTLTTGFLAARVSSGMGRSLRQQIFVQVGGFSPSDVDRFGSASLITRSTNDVTQIQNFIMALLRMVLRAPIIAAGGVFMAYLKSPGLSAIMLVSLPALVLLVVGVARMVMPLSNKMQAKIDRVNLVMREKLTGVRVIRAFGNEAFERERFDSANRDLTDTSIRMQRTASLMMPCANLVMSGTILALIWFGGLRVSHGELLVGDIMALVQYVTQILMSVMMISIVFIMLPRAMSSAGRINEVLETEASIQNPEQRLAGEPQGRLVFENVSFRYPGADADALSHISFDALPGGVTAIIGSTGSGKSTLLRLVERFHDVTEGRILVDGVDLRDYDQLTLRARLGYVPQKAVLFSGTIASNIRQGRPEASDEEVAAAAALAQAAEFIDERAEGFDAPISQGGVNVSGGQKQRLSIARAAVRRPEFYLFDDSFSALDFATDARLRAALARETGQATVIIVAQRVSTIMNAGRIIVLDAGEMAGIGTHSELMKSCEVYQEIVASQLSKEEWGNA